MQLFKDGLKSIVTPFKDIVNVLLPRDEPKNELSDFIFICPRIFWMSFPAKENIQELSESLNTQFSKKNYYIWNLSEYTYNAKFFKNQVADISFPGYPCPSLQYFFLVCKSILEWLSSDRDNVAFIHCQSNKARSAAIIACLLTLLKIVNHPMEALTYFCSKVELEDSPILFPSQYLYVRSFASILENAKVNKKVILLQKIIINEVPKFHEENKNHVYISDKKLLREELFKPYIQIFKGEKAVYNFLKENNPMAYNTNDVAITFDIGIEVTEDLLIRCRHYRNEDERLSVFRIMFNPYLVTDEVLRIYSKDIDFSPEFDASSGSFVDLVLKITDKNNIEAAALCQLRDDCVQLSREHRRKKEISAPKNTLAKAQVAQQKADITVKHRNSLVLKDEKSPEIQRKKIVPENVTMESIKEERNKEEVLVRSSKDEKIEATTEVETESKESQ